METPLESFGGVFVAERVEFEDEGRAWAKAERSSCGSCGRSELVPW
jgi:hypothetical protein